MEYWIIFIFICVITTCILLGNWKAKESNCIITILSIFLIYFSGFRDGLGQDYENYIIKAGWTYNYDLEWLAEPTFTLIAKIITYTTLSPVFMFLFFATITIVCFFSYYKHHNKAFVASTLVMFCLIPIMYFNSFNLVRQICASALFFFALQYILEKKIWKYLLVVIFAASIHLSAIILLPFYFIIDKKIKSFWLISLAILPFFFSQVVNIVLSSTSVFGSYMQYLDSDEEMGSSMMILLYNLIGFSCLLLRNKIIVTKWDNISLNILFLLIAFSNLSFKVFYAFRIAVFFVPVFAYIFPLVLNYLTKSKYLTYIISLSLSLVLFSMLVVGNEHNKKIVPNSILPLTAIEDRTFNKCYKR